MSSLATMLAMPAKVTVVTVAAAPVHPVVPARASKRPAAKKPVFAVVKREQVVRHAKVVEPKTKPKVRPKPGPTHPRSTPSLYERTTSPVILREQGCRAGRARTNGLVVLDFGKPAYRHGRYGTITFVNHFASNTAITWATKSYARGYVECLPKFATARIVLVRGTSNYAIGVPSSYEAGRQWAKETAVLDRYLELHGFDERVDAAGGSDAEPAWDPGFRRTYDFFRGFRAAGNGHYLYNYGSLDGGAGRIWKVRQAYYVAAGMRYARAVPEIYNREMAKQWATLSRIAAARYGKPVTFAGVMTQHSKKCRTGCYTPTEAHSALVGELAKSPKTRVRMLAAVTNIGSPAPRRFRRQQ